PSDSTRTPPTAGRPRGGPGGGSGGGPGGGPTVRSALVQSSTRCLTYRPPEGHTDPDSAHRLPPARCALFYVRIRTPLLTTTDVAVQRHGCRRPAGALGRRAARHATGPPRPG